jgi:Mg2+ and Co2+ transporter CorA
MLMPPCSVTCPGRQLIPLHPLTIEDILGQETREKIEVYDHLGYYFVSFRALDETYFRYSEGASASSASRRSGSSSADIAKRVPSAEGLDEGHHGLDGSSSADKRSSLEKRRSPSSSNEKVALDDRVSVSSGPAPGSSGHDGAREGSDGARRKGKVEIVEGPKEGVEGVGVGAVNVYMVVFGDGVISVSDLHLRSAGYDGSLAAT